MADQKRLELVLDPSKAQSGAKLAVQAVKSVGRQADITANKVGNISKAFDVVLAKLNAVNSKSPDKVFQKLNSTIGNTAAITDKVAQSTDRYQKMLDAAKSKTEFLNSVIGRQIVLERDRHKEITRGIIAQKNAANALTEAEVAQKRLNDAYNKALAQYRELNDATRKSTIYLEESAKQQEKYQRALVDSLSASQRARLAEQDYGNQLKETVAKLAQYKTGVAQKTAEQQAALSVQERLARAQAELSASYTKEYQDLLKTNQQLKERKRELLGLDTAVDDVTQSMSASERAAKKMADSLEFWEQRNKDLQSSEYKKLTTLRESARQLEAYEKSLVDALSPAQKLAKAENELRKEMERGRIQIELFEKGLSQKNIEQQESLSLNRQLAQSQARLNQVYSKEYEQLVKNNAMIRRRKKEIEELNGLTSRKASSGVGSGAAMVGGLLGAASGTFVAAELVRIADAYTNIQNRLAVVTDGTMDLTRATRELLDVSIQSRTSLDTTMDVYAKMIRVTKDMTFANEDLLRITETVSKAVAMSGASAQGAEGALLQFSQALSGDFQAAAQELNSIIEQTPAVAQLMADALNSVQPELNASIGNLKRLASEGQISTEMLLRGILNVSSAIDNQFLNASRTVTQSLTALKDAFTVAFGEVDKALGGTNSLAESIVGLAEDLEFLKDELAGLATGLAAFAASAGVAGLVGLLTMMSPHARVIGLVITALSALIGVATKYQVEAALIKQETEELTQRNKELKLSLEGLKDVYAEMSSQQLLDEFNKQQLKVLETQEEIAELRKKIEAETTYDAAGEFVRISQAGQNLLRQLDATNKVLSTQKEKVDLVQQALKDTYGSDVQGMLQAVWERMLGITTEQTKQANMKRDITNALNSSKSLVEALEEELRVLKLSNAEQVQAMIYMEAYNNLKDKSLGGTKEFIAGVMEQVDAYLALQGQIDEIKGSSGRAATATHDWASELENLRSSLDPVYAANVQFEKSMEVLNKAMKTSDPLYKKLVKSLKDVRDAAIKANDPLEQQAKVFQDIMESLKEEQRQIGKTERELYIYQRTLELTNSAKEKGLEVDSDRLRQLEEEAGRTYDLIEAEKERIKSLEEQQQQMLKLRDTIADTFMDGFEAAMEGGDSFKDWFKNLLKELALLAIRNQIVIPIVGQFMEGIGLGGISGGSGGIGNMVSTGKTIYDIYTGNNSIVNTVGGWLGFGGASAATTTAGYGAFASAFPSTAGYLGMGAGTTTATSGLVGLGGTATSTAGTAGTASSGMSAGWGAAGIAAAVVALPFIAQELDSLFGGDKTSEVTLVNMSDTNRDIYEEDIRLEHEGWMSYLNYAYSMGEADVQPYMTSDFTYNPRTNAGSSLYATYYGRKSPFGDTAVETPFGTLGVGRAEYIDETRLEGVRQFLNAVKNIDEELARYLSVHQIESISGALSDWVYDGGGEISTVAEEVGRQLQERLGIQLSIVDEELSAFVTAAGEGISTHNFERFSAEAQVAILALSIQDTIDIVEVGIETFKAMSVEGENTAQTIIRTVTQFMVVDEISNRLGMNFSDLGNGMIKAADNIVKAAGGLDQFNAAASSYYQNFYSEEERFAHFTDDLINTFKQLGLELPSTTQGFRDLVEGLDLTQESDQALYATLLKLNPRVKQYIDGLDKQKDELKSLYQTISGAEMDSDIIHAYFDAISSGALTFEDASKAIENASSAIKQAIESVNNAGTSSTTTTTTGGVTYETITTYAELTDTQSKLVEAYATALGRMPDAGGWDYYMGLLEDGSKTIYDVTLDLINSAEGQEFSETGVARPLEEANWPEILKPIVEVIEVVTSPSTDTDEPTRRVFLSLLELAEVAGVSFSNFQQFLYRFGNEFNTGIEVTSEIVEALGETIRFATVGHNAETAERFSNIAQIMMTLSESIGSVNLSADVATSTLITIADHFQELAGSGQEFNTTLADYNRLFSDVADAAGGLRDIDLAEYFNDLGLTLPETRDGFVDLVEGFDLTDAASRSLYWALIDIAPEMDAYLKALMDTGDEYRDLVNTLDGLLEDVYNAVEAERERVIDSYDTQRKALEQGLKNAEEQLALVEEQDSALDGLRRTVDLLSNAFEKMHMDTDSAFRSRRMDAQVELQRMREEGVSDNDLLSKVLNTLSEPSEQLFSSFEDYARDFYVTKNLIGEMLGENEDQLTVEERTLKQLRETHQAQIDFYQKELDTLDTWYEDQMKYLDNQYQLAVDMYNEALNINQNIQSIPVAIDALRAAIISMNAQPPVGSTGGSGGGTPSNPPQLSNRDRLIQIANESGGMLSSTVTDAQVSTYWLANVPDRVIDSIVNGNNWNIEGFADGGIHTGGWRIVGEEGPELEYTPPSRIYSNPDSSDMFDMSELVAEVKQLREDVRSGNYAVAKNTQRAAKILDRWDYDGQPEVRTA